MTTGNEREIDDAGLNALFKEHFVPLCAYCQYQFDFTLDTAKEAVHTGFIKLWDNRHHITPDHSAKAYLHTIVANTARDMIRHEKVKLKHFEFVSRNTESFEDNSYQPDLRNLAAEIDTAVAELPTQMRRVFEMSRYDGLKYREIAEQLDISVKTVETQMSRALSKLRERLSQYLAFLPFAFLLNYKIFFFLVGVFVPFAVNV